MALPLQPLKNLGDLNLADTPVTDAGLNHLRRFDSLSVLSLSGCPVSDAGMSA